MSQQGGSFSERWLGRQAHFTLMGQTCKGKVVSVIERTGRPTEIVAWFLDGTKYVRASGPWQGFTRV